MSGYPLISTGLTIIPTITHGNPYFYKNRKAYLVIHKIVDKLDRLQEVVEQRLLVIFLPSIIMELGRKVSVRYPTYMPYIPGYIFAN